MRQCRCFARTANGSWCIQMSYRHSAKGIIPRANPRRRTFHRITSSCFSCDDVGANATGRSMTSASGLSPIFDPETGAWKTPLSSRQSDLGGDRPHTYPCFRHHIGISSANAARKHTGPSDMLDCNVDMYSRRRHITRIGTLPKCTRRIPFLVLVPARELQRSTSSTRQQQRSINSFPEYLLLS